jgi:hypothetical protein
MVKPNEQYPQDSYIDIPITPKGHSPEETMRWVSVSDFTTAEPVPYTSLLPDAGDAGKALGTATYRATAYTLLKRGETPEGARPVPNIGNVASFIGGLGFRANGNIYEVDDYKHGDEQLTDVLSVTSGLRRQSLVIANNIKRPRKSSSSLPEITDQMVTEYAAAVELTHLSGIPEVGYFIADPEDPAKLLDARFSAPALMHPTNPKQGGYFEHGMAALCANKYIWSNYPGIGDNKATEVRISPDGEKVALPAKHSFAYNNNAYMSWGMEQLIQSNPEIWDIFVKSRQKGVDNTEVRAELKEATNTIYDELFEIVDKIDHKVTSQVIGATALIGVVSRYKTL